ncbi:hypothetical protein M404DRAFT_512414 [Pisolithus tinctorius Marx 270]|uniref:Uncharacterized protein n=1 Tax=Pisolithus tinctorius Marx 270 TaxID=870435 RepID=A0A0C3PC65_PISTI|nr:hypothetical protein M404DRAFT_512414 [Pisolithus tinctorius Marx 270]
MHRTIDGLPEHYICSIANVRSHEPSRPVQLLVDLSVRRHLTVPIAYLYSMTGHHWERDGCQNVTLVQPQTDVVAEFSRFLGMQYASYRSQSPKTSSQRTNTRYVFFELHLWRHDF